MGITDRSVTMVFIKLVFGFGLVVSGVWGHGYLWEPAQRSSAWRRGFGTPTNYNDNQLFCGGSSFQKSHDGKCGACGDPYGGPYENEAGGTYATGTITGHYNQGDVIEADVKMTAYHQGYFEFRICPNNDVTQRVSQDCLDSNLLPIVGYNTNTVNYTAAATGTTRLQLNDLGIGTGWYSVHLQLPADMTCTQCVLQWKYKTGNSWGCEDVNGQRRCGMGLGHQEHFINCADVQITATTTTTGTGGTTSGYGNTTAPVSSSSMSSSSKSTTSTTVLTTTITLPETTTTTTMTEPITTTTTETPPPPSTSTETTAQQETSTTTTEQPETTTTTTEQPETTTEQPETTTTMTEQPETTTTTTEQPETTTTEQPETTTTTTEQPETTTTTTAPPETTATTTTTSATPQDCTHNNNIQCIVVPPYDAVPGMKNWCVVRCKYEYSTCPPSHCLCTC